MRPTKDFGKGRERLHRKKGRKSVRELEKKEQLECEGSTERRRHVDPNRDSFRRLEAAKSDMRELWEEMGRSRSHLLSRRRERLSQRAAFEAKIASSACEGPDVLLGCVKENLDLLVTHVIEAIASPPHHHHHQLSDTHFPPLVEELLRLHYRSRDMLVDFSGFYCIRLVLDEQSPLATQFTDFFCDLQWLLIRLIPQIEPFINSVMRICMPSTHIDMASTHFHNRSTKTHMALMESSKALLASLKPVVHTCIALHCLYKLSRESSNHAPACKFQRAVAKKPRMFSEDVYHCLSRTFGALEAWNLDSYKDTKVELDEEPLGEGGFASVCKGHFVRTASGEIIGDPVAVKMLLRESSQSESEASSIFTDSGNDSSSSSTEHMQGYSNLRDYLLGMSEHGYSSNTGEFIPLGTHVSELRKLASLQHPNIVVVKGYIARRELSNGMIAESGIVMELMDGSLDKIVHQVQEEGNAAFSELEMVDLMLEIAKAMRFMHECGVTHRDLKPANVLLRYTLLSAGLGCLEVKVGDLGLTKCMSSSSTNLHMVEHTTPVGTTGYMAPELRGVDCKAAYTDKVDVYSYGITCLDIMTGIPDGRIRTGKYKELYTAAANGKWKNWVKAEKPDCPKHLVNVIECCLQEAPSRRPTFAEICFALQQTKRCLLLVQKMPDHVVWPHANELGLTMIARALKGLSEEGDLQDEFRSSAELSVMKGLVLGKVVCHALGGTKLMNSLIDNIPEAPQISVQGYFLNEGEEHRKWKREKEKEADTEVAKTEEQHQKWKNNALVQAISNVMAMEHHTSQTRLLISGSDKLLHALHNLCTHLLDDIFTRFSRRCDCPDGRCECELNNMDQKATAQVWWDQWIINELSQRLLELDGIQELYDFGNQVDTYAGIKHGTLTQKEIEAMTPTCSRKYLLYRGLYCPLTKNGWRNLDALLNDFKAKWIKHEVISTLLRWSWVWKSSGVSMPVPWEEDVIDYTLVCKLNLPSASSHLTLCSSFDLSLSESLRAHKPLPLVDLGGDDACSFNEDESMLPLLMGFYVLFQ